VFEQGIVSTGEKNVSKNDEKIDTFLGYVDEIDV